MCIKFISYFVFINLLLMSDILRYFLCELFSRTRTQAYHGL